MRGVASVVVDLRPVPQDEAAVVGADRYARCRPRLHAVPVEGGVAGGVNRHGAMHPLVVVREYGVAVNGQAVTVLQPEPVDLSRLVPVHGVAAGVGIVLLGDYVSGLARAVRLHPRFQGNGAGDVQALAVGGGDLGFRAVKHHRLLGLVEGVISHEARVVRGWRRGHEGLDLLGRKRLVEYREIIDLAVEGINLAVVVVVAAPYLRCIRGRPEVIEPVIRVSSARGKRLCDHDTVHIEDGRNTILHKAHVMPLIQTERVISPQVVFIAGIICHYPQAVRTNGMVMIQNLESQYPRLG